MEMSAVRDLDGVCGSSGRVYVLKLAEAELRAAATSQISLETTWTGLV